MAKPKKRKKWVDEIKSIMYTYSVSTEEINRLNRELNEMLALANESRDTLKANTITDMPTSRGVSNPVLKSIEVVVDIYGERAVRITRQINHLINLQTCVSETFDTILRRDPLGHRILRHRYIDWMKDLEVMGAMNYSNLQSVYTLLRRTKAMFLEEYKRQMKARRGED